MGEWAEDILDGNVCESCGEWLGGGEGYPVLCFYCEEQKEKDR